MHCVMQVCLKHNSLALQSTLHWLGPEVCTVCGLQASQIILMVDMILKISSASTWACTVPPCKQMRKGHAR